MSRPKLHPDTQAALDDAVCQLLRRRHGGHWERRKVKPTRKRRAATSNAQRAEDGAGHDGEPFGVLSGEKVGRGDA